MACWLSDGRVDEMSLSVSLDADTFVMPQRVGKGFVKRPEDRAEENIKYQ